MDAVPIFLALLVMGWAGGVAAALLLSRRVNIAELSAWSVLLGGPLISFALFLGGFFLSGLTLRCVVVALVIVFTVLAWPKICKLAPIFRFPRSLLEISLLTILFLQLAFVAWQSLAQPLRWDGLFAWELKARFAFLNGGHMPLSYYRDPSRQWSHPEYPLAVPLAEEWLYGWIGAERQDMAKIPCPFIYAAAMALLFVAARRHAARPCYASITAALPFFVPCLVIGPGSASSGWADFPLAAVYLIVITCLLNYASIGARSSLRILAVSAAILPWIKQEGMILAASAFVIGFFLAWRRREIGPMLLAALPATFIVIAWKVFLALVHTPPAIDFLPLTPTTVLENIHRLAGVAQFLAHEIIRWNRWSVLWPVTFFALCDLMRRGRQPALILAGAISLPIALYSSIYVFSSLPDYLVHVSTSLPRLMIDAALVAILAIGLSMNGGAPMAEEKK